MSAVFADTFFFLAILNPADPAHRFASQVSFQLRQPLVTTAWVVTDVGDAFARDNRSAFLALIDLLHDNALIRVVGPSQELLDEGVALYRARPDKGWSLTDCISFVVMEREGIRDALTADRHFVQAGFAALL